MVEHAHTVVVWLLLTAGVVSGLLWLFGRANHIDVAFGVFMGVMGVALDRLRKTDDG